MSDRDSHRPKSTRDYWQDGGGSVWTQQSHQQPEVQGFQVFAWSRYSPSSASDKDITDSEGIKCASARSVLPCWCAVSSSAACFSVVAAVTHFLKIYEIQSYVRKWTVQHMIHVPGCVSASFIFIFRESTQNKVQHVFFSVSRHGNMTPCKWCVVRTKLKKQRCEYRPHWIKKNKTLYLYICSHVKQDFSWGSRRFARTTKTSCFLWLLKPSKSQKLANNMLNLIWTKCLHALVLLHQTLQHIFSWV